MVLIGTSQKRQGPITAAASSRTLKQLSAGKVGEVDSERLWELYETLGPVHYGIGFKRNAATKISYFPAEVTEDDEEPTPTEEKAVTEAFDRISGPFGGFEEIVGEFMVHLNVIGEGWLVGQEREEKEDWDVWSTIELNAARQQGAPKPDAVEPLTDDDFTLRIWRPHPMRRERADSPLRSVQTQCEQLTLLNEQIGAVAMSRLSAGILLVASEASFGREAGEPPDDGANSDGDPFTKEIIEILISPITDSDSAARVAPGLLRLPHEIVKDGVRWIDFAREIDSTFAEMREELLRQIAAGLDLPAEILTGLAELNHWSLWGVDESAAKMHVDPDVLLILDSITRGYLWPTLREMNVSDPERFVIWRDFSDLTSRPVSIEHAQQLLDRNVVNAEYVRRVANLTDDDAPGDKLPPDYSKKIEAVGALIRAGFDPTASAEAVGLPEIAHTGLRPVTVQSQAQLEEIPEAEAPAGPEDVETGPPGLAAAATKIRLDGLADIDRTLALRVTEATESAFHRALERAGTRIRNKASKDRTITSQIDGLANHLVTQRLGPRLTEQLQLTADQLLPSDTFDPLAERLNKLVADAQEARRSELSQIIEKPIPETPDESEDRVSAVASFIAALFALATARLFTPAPEPDPAESGEFTDALATVPMVQALLTEAGGGGKVTEFSPDSPRGLALGQRTRAALVDAGYLTTSQTWAYGFWGYPARNFEGHRALSGIAVTDIETPALRVPFQYSWLGVSHFYPGDHKGCTCELVPTVELS